MSGDAAAIARARPCLGCIALALGIVAAVVASFAYLAVDWKQLFGAESIRLMAKFVAEFFPPDVSSAFLAKATWGPFAGTLALALHTTGVLGRLYAESLENAPRAPEQALRDAGSGRVAAFAYATLPLVVAQAIAYALYRLEMNIRMAAVLGFVGAGGLGQLLYFHLSIFQQQQAATLLIAMFVLVFAVDSLSAFVRARLLPAHA